MNASGLRLQVKFEQPDSSDINEWLVKWISELLLIIEHELGIQPHDRVGTIFSNSNHAKVDFSLSFRPFSQYSTDSILFELEKVIQSNTEFCSDNNLVINVDHVRVPVGYGNPPRYHIGKLLKNIIVLMNEIIRLQNFLGIDYRIVVYASRDGKVILFKACHEGFKHTINILFDENHYSLILSPTAVFATAYFCKYCCIGYTSKLGHSRCWIRCNKCFHHRVRIMLW